MKIYVINRDIKSYFHSFYSSEDDRVVNRIKASIQYFFFNGVTIEQKREYTPFLEEQIEEKQRQFIKKIYRN